MANVVHAADLGSTCNPPPIYFDWMQRVFREFFHQGEQERKAGIPVTPFMDRATASIPKAQQGFLKYICTPLFRALADVIPAFKVAVDNANDVVEALHELEEFNTDQIMTASRLQDLLPKWKDPELEPLKGESPSPSPSSRAESPSFNLSARASPEKEGMQTCEA